MSSSTAVCDSILSGWTDDPLSLLVSATARFLRPVLAAAGCVFFTAGLLRRGVGFLTAVLPRAASGEESRPFSGTLVVVVVVLVRVDLLFEGLRFLAGDAFFLRASLNAGASSGMSCRPCTGTVMVVARPSHGGKPLSSSPESRSASTITLIRHGESIECDVLVILRGVMSTAVVGVDNNGRAGWRTGGRERREGVGGAIEGPLAAARGSGEDE